MAGHSKWKNTRRRKFTQDLKRGKIFTKLIRDVKTAAKLGGRDLVYNPRLRMLLEKALSSNMTKSTFNRAISSYFNELSSREILEEIIYEGYGPGGIALLLKCFTNNKNRLVSEIRYVLSKFGGNLGIQGSVSYLFKKRGMISCFSNLSEDIIMDIALKIGADDVIFHKERMIKIYVSLELLPEMELRLKSFNLVIFELKIFMSPYLYIDLNSDNSCKLFSLIDMLKNISDVYEVYHNGKFLKN